MVTTLVVGFGIDVDVVGVGLGYIGILSGM